MNVRSLVFGLTAGLVVGASGLAQTPAATPPPVADLPDAPSTTSQAKAPVEPMGPTVLIDTTMGRLTCRLYDKQAPVTTANFVGLAQGTKEWTDPDSMKKVKGKPFYNGGIRPTGCGVG